MVVAMLALVLAISGPALADQAATVAKKVINGKTIKNKSITGSKLKSNTITGTQVNESKLGKVPSAAKADSATNATNAVNAANAVNATNASKLAGVDGGAFVQRLWAVVDGTSTTPSIVRSAGTVGDVEDIGGTGTAGLYGVTFNKDVSGCASLVTVGDQGAGTTPAGYATAEGRLSSQPNAIEIRTFDSTGTLSNRDFHLVIIC
jgi:hypothetical protein